jgi:hypothetical protein
MSQALALQAIRSRAAPLAPEVRRAHHLVVLYRPDGPPWQPDQMQPALEALPITRGRHWHLRADGPLLAGWLDDRPAEDGPDCGPLLVCAGDLASPAVLANAATAVDLAAGKPEAAARLDGAFAALAWVPGEGRCALATDRFGLFPIYRYDRAGTFAYSTSLAALTALMHPTCSIDPVGVNEMLVLSLVLGERTLAREVSVVAPATLVRLQGHAPEPVPYWDWQQLTVPGGDGTPADADLVHQTYALIEQAVLAGVPPSGAVAVPLSGGLDSRMLCAVLARNGVKFQTYNIDFGKEARIARQVAKVLRVPLRGLPMLGAPRAIPEAHEDVDSSYHVNQVWGAEMARQAAKDGCTALLDGFAFDTILGGGLHVEGDTPQAMAGDLLATFGEIDEEGLARVAGPKTAAAITATLKESLTEAARRALAQAGALASDYYLLTNRLRKYTFGYCLANLRHLPCRFPYVTRPLIDHCLRLPPEQRREHTLYRRIYSELYPELARIPWAKTGLPLDRYAVPRTPRWQLLASAALRRLTGGRLRLAERGAFGAEFSRRSDLRAVFLEHLGANWAPLAHCLPPEVAANAVRNHLAGRDVGCLLQALYTVKAFQSRFARGTEVGGEV